VTCETKDSELLESVSVFDVSTRVGLFTREIRVVARSASLAMHLALDYWNEGREPPDLRSEDIASVVAVDTVLVPKGANL